MTRSNGIERRTPTKAKTIGLQHDYMTHKDNGKESDPQAQNVRHASDPRSSRRTLRDVSRQILAEFGPHDSSRIVVNRRSTLARVHSTHVARLKVHYAHPRHSCFDFLGVMKIAFAALFVAPATVCS